MFWGFFLQILEIVILQMVTSRLFFLNLKSVKIKIIKYDPAPIDVQPRPSESSILSLNLNASPARVQLESHESARWGPPAGWPTLSGSSALDNNGAGHDVVHSPVVLEEEQRDEDGKEEGDGEVLVERPHRRPA